ncbi:hypothetical protein HMPREF0972_02169 [Actinomyces sp. oral taxon 848 str. F0332]|nr:hypothetical protein HMPREF0972_02169 [Actinomyces sp. oral taxon 848 str. F0332]
MRRICRSENAQGQTAVPSAGILLAQLEIHFRLREPPASKTRAVGKQEASFDSISRQG